MLDERKVSALNDILLVLFPMVQGNLFGVFEQTRMGKAELALEFGFVRCVRAEWRCDGFDWTSGIGMGKERVSRDVRMPADVWTRMVSITRPSAPTLRDS